MGENLQKKMENSKKCVHFLFIGWFYFLPESLYIEILLTLNSYYKHLKLPLMKTPFFLHSLVNRNHGCLSCAELLSLCFGQKEKIYLSKTILITHSCSIKYILLDFLS